MGLSTASYRDMFTFTILRKNHTPVDIIQDNCLVIPYADKLRFANRIQLFGTTSAAHEIRTSLNACLWINQMKESAVWKACT
jgi:hypothetical protein